MPSKEPLIPRAYSSSRKGRSAEARAPTITGTGPYTWTYSVSLATNFNLQAGDEFVIYDFTGLIPGSAFAGPVVIGPWSVAEDPGLTTPPPGVGTLTIPDDPTRPNLVFTYQGTGFTNNTGVDVLIGLFGANCSSGRTYATLPERWEASWENNLRLAQMADAIGIECFHSAQCGIEGGKDNSEQYNL